MESITFTCETITPMFLAGADGQTPELRAPSIKGALRFWWRAMHGHLPVDKLKEKESLIFGGTERSGRSNVIIRVTHPALNIDNSELVPHKPFMKQEAIQIEQDFDVLLTLTRTIQGFSLDQLRALFILTCVLGGFGKRVRRGMGSVHIKKCSDENHLPKNIDLFYIHQLMMNFSPFYILADGSIDFNYSGKSAKFGYIKQIQIGNSQAKESQLLRRISDATHDVKSANDYAYDPSMGHAFKGRYASPVYVSVIKGSVKPIITTLNIAPDKNEHNASLLIQEEFKNRIL